MGMDLVGRMPVNEEGEYFRANVWSWRPIYQLIYDHGSDLFDTKILEGMSSNDGFGPTSVNKCRQLADRLTIWLEHNTKGFSLDEGTYVVIRNADDEYHSFATVDEINDPHINTVSAYRVEDEHLKVFVNFLYNCGGFQVY